MGRILLIAPAGGLIGCFLGAVICVIFSLPHAKTNIDVALTIIQIGLGLFSLSSIVAVPVCIIIGAPIIYLFRHKLTHSPFAWSAVIGLIGALLSAGSLYPLYDGRPKLMESLVLLLFGTTCAFSFALLYGWRARKRLIKLN